MLGEGPRVTQQGQGGLRASAGRTHASLWSNVDGSASSGSSRADGELIPSRGYLIYLWAILFQEVFPSFGLKPARLPSTAGSFFLLPDLSSPSLSLAAISSEGCSLPVCPWSFSNEVGTSSLSTTASPSVQSGFAPGRTCRAGLAQASVGASPEQGSLLVI